MVSLKIRDCITIILIIFSWRIDNQLNRCSLYFYLLIKIQMHDICNSTDLKYNIGDSLAWVRKYPYYIALEGTFR